MNTDSVSKWVGRKKRQGVLLNISFGLLGFLLGCLVLFLTFWFTYAVVWFGWYGVAALSDLLLNKKLHLTHGWRLIVSGTFVVLLFLQHFRTSRWYWGDYTKDDYNEPHGLATHAGVGGALAILLAHPGTSANMIADILLCGPRLVVVAVWMMILGFQWRKLDVPGCADLLLFLHQRAEAVPYAELESAGWQLWLAQIRQIEGVMFLEKGLTLTADLRAELEACS